MDLPDQGTASNWEGAAVVDRAGERLGRCTGVFADVDTDATEWITVTVDEHRRLFIPALGATESGGTLRVSFARGDVLTAPRVGDEQELSKADEVRLYGHYGVAHTPAASGSVLPTKASAQSPSNPTSDQVTEAPDPASEQASERAPAPPPTDALSVSGRPTSTPTGDTPLSWPAPATTQPDEAPVLARTVEFDAPAPLDPVADVNDLVPDITAPETLLAPPAPANQAPLHLAVEPGQDSSAPARPTLRSTPRAGTAPASPAVPLAVVAGIVAMAGIALRAWELRARRRRRPSARAARAGKQATSSSVSAVRAAAKQLTEVNAAAATTTRQLADAASTATGSAAGSGSAVTSSVAAIPLAVARRGRRARRSVASGLRDVAAVGTAGTGYVAGAKAGRGWYEQINQQAHEVASSPQVKTLTDAVLGPAPTSATAGRDSG